MDGIYDINFNTPMGRMCGKIYLKEKGNGLISCMLEIMNMKNNLEDGKVQFNKCYFTGNLKNKMLNINYNIAAELIGNTLNIYAKTNMGDFSFKANKIG